MAGVELKFNSVLSVLHSNQAVVGAPFGVTLPPKLAPSPAKADELPVVTDGGGGNADEKAIVNVMFQEAVPAV